MHWLAALTLADRAGNSNPFQESRKKCQTDHPHQSADAPYSDGPVDQVDRGLVCAGASRLFRPWQFYRFYSACAPHSCALAAGAAAVGWAAAAA